MKVRNILPLDISQLELHHISSTNHSRAELVLSPTYRALLVRRHTEPNAPAAFINSFRRCLSSLQAQ